jgi:hypothetical protein
MSCRVTYLSDEWVGALDDVLAGAQPPEAPRPGGGGCLAVQYQVVGGPAGGRSWHLDLAPDRLRARPGEAADPAVTFTQPWAVATAIATGRRSATEALLTGDVAVRGDASVLLPWRDALRRAGDALAALAAVTDFPSDEEG